MNEFEKVTLRLKRGDVAVLKEFYPNAGYNKVVRALVSRHVKRLQEAESRATSDQLTPTEISL